MLPSLAVQVPQFGVEQLGSRLSPLAGGAFDVLERSFGVDFTILDVDAGAALHRSSVGPGQDWHGAFALCREVARRGRADFIAEEGPVLVLAIPLPLYSRQSLVALGAFITHPVTLADEVSGAARLWSGNREETLRWATGQTPWSAETLLRMAALVVEKLSAERTAERMRGELEQVTTHLLNTYEEISLLHRLTQNLKLSRNETDLASMALEWLSEALPAEGLAIKLNPKPECESVLGREPQEGPLVLTYGRFPVETSQFDVFVQQLDREALHVPIVLNRAVTSKFSWPYPLVREVISVPLMEGSNTFGHLVAVNNTHGGEFGTVEASLISSVGAILGIHAGNIDLYRQQAAFLASVVRALTSAIDAKDPYTCGHSDRVARLSKRLAEELGCDLDTLNTIYLSGLLHDIGKIGIDDTVLRKPGKLTEAEYEHIKLHPELGYKILRDLKQLDQVLPVVLHHHEAWNGEGYPHGLAGEDIPLLARIVAVADSVDAMSSDRPYRKGMDRETFEEILRDGAGSQWDSRVVDAYFRLGDELIEIIDEGGDSLTLDVPLWN